MPVLQKASYRKGRKRGNAEIVPTIMLQNERNQIYVQNGNFFGPSGRHIEEPPLWALEAVRALPKKLLAPLGFEVKFGKLKPKVVKPEVPAEEPELDLTDEDDADKAAA